MPVHQMRCLRKRGNAANLKQFSLVKTATLRPAKRHDGKRGDQLPGVWCSNEARPVLCSRCHRPRWHTLKRYRLLADRCRIRHSDPICGVVRRPNAETLVWMSVRWRRANLPRPKAFLDLPDRRYFFPMHRQPGRLLPRYRQRRLLHPQGLGPDWILLL
jgi:hypothetical protein